MTRLAGRVAIVTGAGRGLGREHALYLAAEGAAVVVNDIGSGLHGEGAESDPAQEVVDEIRSRGGRAVISRHDVSDWDASREMIALAVDAFGHLDVLVNNAGIIRDRTLANMEEAEWDAVIRVLLKGHAAPTRHAVTYWRERTKAGHEVRASVIHTTSAAGLAGNVGQANYAAAKLGVLAISRVVSLEAGRYGVRSNAISPSARTRMTLAAGSDARRAAQGSTPEKTVGFDPRDPANVSPLVAWLAWEGCPADSQVFHITANRILVIAMPTIAHMISTSGRWTLDALDRELTTRLLVPTSIESFHVSLEEPSVPRE